jgi:hypothetical protein
VGSGNGSSVPMGTGVSSVIIVEGAHALVSSKTNNRKRKLLNFIFISFSLELTT